MYTRDNGAQDETEEARVPRGTCQCWHTWHVGQRRHVLPMTREFWHAWHMAQDNTGTLGTWHDNIGTSGMGTLIKLLAHRIHVADEG